MAINLGTSSENLQALLERNNVPSAPRLSEEQKAWLETQGFFDKIDVGLDSERYRISWKDWQNQPIDNPYCDLCPRFFHDVIYWERCETLPTIPGFTVHESLARLTEQSSPQIYWVKPNPEKEKGKEYLLCEDYESLYGAEWKQRKFIIGNSRFINKF